MPKWTYGITTVPERRETTLPLTLESLRFSGFDKPIVFCDGMKDGSRTKAQPYPGGLDTVYRSARLGAYGNFILALWELYIRSPLLDRYAVFQDDLICSKNLKAYLDKQELPKQGYWNLFTFMKSNEERVQGKPPGWYEADQYGRGGLALVFSREAVVQLLSSKCSVMKPQHAKFGKSKLDGAVVTALAPTHKQPGGIFKEYIHNPSLVQHIGDVSAIGHRSQPKALTFKQDFDCLSLLNPLKEAEPITYQDQSGDVWVKVG